MLRRDCRRSPGGALSASLHAAHGAASPPLPRSGICARWREGWFTAARRGLPPGLPGHEGVQLNTRSCESDIDATRPRTCFRLKASCVEIVEGCALLPDRIREGAALGRAGTSTMPSPTQDAVDRGRRLQRRPKPRIPFMGHAPRRAWEADPAGKARDTKGKGGRDPMASSDMRQVSQAPSHRRHEDRAEYPHDDIQQT